MRYLMAGGGTGGHIYPALSIAQALQELDPAAEFLFVGSERGLEKKIIPQYGYVLEYLDIQAFQRKLSWDTLKTVFKATKSLVTANRILSGFKPDVVIGTGGYVSGPPVLAAQLRNIPTVIQEQNALPGATTKVLALRADLVLVGYDIARERLVGRRKQPDNLLITGNPIRLDITETNREEGCRILGLEPSKLTLLVFGASQGSKAINNAVFSIMPNLCELPGIQVIWQTGENQFGGIKRHLPSDYQEVSPDLIKYKNMQIRPYIHQMSAALAATDLVVSRAGAISLAEVTAKGIPAILIPLPSAAENHQEHNARALEKAGAAIIILEQDLRPEILLREITQIFEDTVKRQTMAMASRRLGKPLAARVVADQIMKLAAKRHH